MTQGLKRSPILPGSARGPLCRGSQFVSIPQMSILICSPPLLQSKSGKCAPLLNPAKGPPVTAAAESPSRKMVSPPPQINLVSFHLRRRLFRNLTDHASHLGIIIPCCMGQVPGYNNWMVNNTKIDLRLWSPRSSIFLNFDPYPFYGI